MCYNRRIRNISKGAVVGAGPYEQVFRQSDTPDQTAGVVRHIKNLPKNETSRRFPGCYV